MQKIRADADMNLGSNLRKLRQEHSFTQDQLVAKLNILEINLSRAIYSRYETGELNVPVRTIVALRDIYDCAYDEFFKGLHL